MKTFLITDTMAYATKMVLPKNYENVKYDTQLLSSNLCLLEIRFTNF